MNNYVVFLQMVDNTTYEIIMRGKNEESVLNRIGNSITCNEGDVMTDINCMRVVINFGLVKYARIKNNNITLKHME